MMLVDTATFEHGLQRFRRRMTVTGRRLPVLTRSVYLENSSSMRLN